MGKLWGCLLACTAMVSAACADDVTYATGSWPEDGNGNHRAVVRVAEAADAVWAHIEWRRADRDPEARDVRLYDLATGKRVLNAVRAGITPVAGDIVFQPSTVPGEYAVYYLPYTAPQGNFDDPGEYYPPQDTAAPDWLARNGLAAEGLQSGAWQRLPRAALLRIEARTDFDRRDPMEVIATPEEVRGLLDRFREASYLVFPEDRRYPIRMLDELPQRWIAGGPAESFAGEAQPGEYYCFQLGVWAARRALGGLALEIPMLQGGGGGVIPRDQVTCLNLEGTDWLGRPMAKSVRVSQGRVQPLWVGIQVPRSATGTYSGTFTVKPQGAEARSVKLALHVSGPVLEDGGVSELWRMSRLKWLNSTLGLDDDVVPPFTPLQIRGNTIRCLLREVRFGALGLPDRVLSSGRQVLAAPMALTVVTGQGPLSFTPGQAQLPKVAPGVIERVSVATGRDADLTVRCRMEADGCLTYDVTLDPQRPLQLSDVRLEIPQRRDCAVYMMGLGKRGGFRPPEWRWKWDHKRANNMVWLGDVGAGMQLQLRGDQDVWEPVALTAAGFAAQWDNDGKGGCTVTEEGDCVRVRAYTGDRTLRPGQPLALRFRLLITPLKPIDPNHWNWRYGDTNADGTVLHVHHGTPENPFINYPFLTVPELTSLVAGVKAQRTRQVDRGKLEYPAAGNLNPQRGAVHTWTTVDFDPAAGGAGQARYNQPLFHVEWPGAGWVGFYWNIDDRGMRAYVATGSMNSPQFPVLIPSSSPEWKRGERHLVTLSWGDEFAIFVDGRKKAAVPFRGTLDLPPDDARIGIDGSGFILEALKITDAPFSEGESVTPTTDDHTLLLDNFAEWRGGPTTAPVRALGGGGVLTGVCEATGDGDRRGLHLTCREEPAPPKGVNLYDNVGQMSNHAAELWVIRSLGDEIMPIADTNPTKVGGTTFGAEGGGYPWLREHLVSGYVPGWRQPLPWIGQTCASLEMQPLSRWHNYYIEGLNWLVNKMQIDGLYIDDVAFDRTTMKRVRKVLDRGRSEAIIDLHSANQYNPRDGFVNSANLYLEHFPYINRLWFGEYFDPNSPADFWFIEMSGVPYGLMGEMLQDGGNKWRGMVFGMTSRMPYGGNDPSPIWKVWDDFRIQDSEMIGYWSPGCPVRTDNKDVLATAFVGSGKTLVSIGSWAQDDVNVRLSIDWRALGIDPGKAILTAPEVRDFQPAARFGPDDPIPVPKGKGWLLIIGAH